jgi:hypothetical protein
MGNISVCNYPITETFPKRCSPLQPLAVHGPEPDVQGSILQNYILAENFSDKFSSLNCGSISNSKQNVKKLCQFYGQKYLILVPRQIVAQKIVARKIVARKIVARKSVAFLKPTKLSREKLSPPLNVAKKWFYNIGPP